MSHPSFAIRFCGIQPGSVDRPRRRRLLHRDVHVRVVPGRADSPLARPGSLAAGDAAARPCQSADMRGDPDSCGVWAPCLTHAGGRFHLVYTDVKRYGPHDHRGGVRRVAARLHKLRRDQRADRRRMVGPRLLEQQRLRSVALSRRRRPLGTCSTCCGTTGRGRTASPESSCRSIRQGSSAWSANATPSSAARRSGSPRGRISTNGTAITTC
jgi:hypothetical protein